MDKQTKVIFWLLGIVLILSVIFGLKVAKIIKPSEKEIITANEKSNINTMNNLNGNSIYDYDKNSSDNEGLNINNITNLQEIYGNTYNTNQNTSKIMKILTFFEGNAIIIIIIVYTIIIIINFGKARLFEKLEMPNWIIRYTQIYPFIVLLIGLIFNKASGVINLITVIISLISLSYYYRAAGMSGGWPIIGIGGIILAGVSVAVGLSARDTVRRFIYNNINTNSNNDLYIIRYCKYKNRRTI